MTNASPPARAVGDLVLVAFYSLLQVSEYTVSNVRFFARNPSTGSLQQLPPWARPAELLAATHATLRFGNQKNRWKIVCVHQEANRLSRVLVPSQGAGPARYPHQIHTT